MIPPVFLIFSLTFAVGIFAGSLILLNSAGGSALRHLSRQDGAALT